MVNAALVVIKLAAGIVGHSYALVADAVESSTDIFASLIVWGGLHVASQPADESHPYGHGKAEALATAAVSLMLLGAAIGIVIAAIREIMSPHHVPATFTLYVLAGVIVVKELLFRKVLAVGHDMESNVVMADAWHHRSDAITSAAAFVGIALAIWGGERWASADDWAAIAAGAIIAINGGRFLRVAVNDLMDRMPAAPLIEEIDRAARSVAGVLATEKLRVRRFGTELMVDLHVQADPTLSLHDAHILSGKVKGAIRSAVPSVRDVLVHMEPFEP
jgi:cation diffusion facilitator family transporter